MLFGIKEELNYKIEEIVKQFDIDYIDAALYYCEVNKLDEEYVGTLLAKNPILKSKIEQSAENLNFLPKKDRIPI